jgi:hypothetical protein
MSAADIQQAELANEMQAKVVHIPSDSTEGEGGGQRE